MNFIGSYPTLERLDLSTTTQIEIPFHSSLLFLYATSSSLLTQLHLPPIPNYNPTTHLPTSEKTKESLVTSTRRYIKAMIPLM